MNAPSGPGFETLAGAPIANVGVTPDVRPSPNPAAEICSKSSPDVKAVIVETDCGGILNTNVSSMPASEVKLLGASFTTSVCDTRLVASPVAVFTRAAAMANRPETEPAARPSVGVTAGSAIGTLTEPLEPI